MNSTFINTLEKHKSSITRERKQLFTILDEAHSPLTIQELVKKAEKHAINRSTVYRTIDLFESLNIIHRVYTGWKFKIELSDTFSSHHHHITCTNCGKVISIEDPKGLEASLQDIEKRYQFRILQHTIELRGLCDECDTYE